VAITAIGRWSSGNPALEKKRHQQRNIRLPRPRQWRTRLCTLYIYFLQPRTSRRSTSFIPSVAWRCRFVKRCAVPFLRSDCLNPMLRVAIAGLSLEHSDAHESVTVFLKELVLSARNYSVSSRCLFISAIIFRQFIVNYYT